MESPEMLTIRWDGFMAYRRKSLRELREKDEFNDVTLIAGDGKPVRAQQVILAGGSSFFYVVLKDNVHEDPSIYLTGIKYENLVSLLDYIYTGEANIAQQDLNQFVDILEEYEVQGLLKIGTLEESQATHEEPCPSLKVSNPHSTIFSSQDPVATEERSAATRIIAPHEGRVATQERSAALKISAQHEDRVATEDRVSAPRLFAPHEGRVATQNRSAATRIIAPHEGQVATQERSAAPRISAQHEGRVLTEECVSVPRISAPHKGQVATQERASKNADIVTSPQSNNPVPQSTCMEDHGNTGNVKVEVGDANRFNVYYETNEDGEANIREVSKRVDVAIPATVERASSNPHISHSNNILPKSTCMEGYGGISNVKVEDDSGFDLYYGKNKHSEEYIRNVSKRVVAKVQRKGLCMEQKNYQSLFTGRNEENDNSVSDAQVKKAKIFDNDWYQLDTHPMKECSVNIKKVTIPKLTDVSSKSSIYSENYGHQENLDKIDNSERSFDREGMVDSNYDMIDIQVEDKRSHTGDKTYWYQCKVCHKKFLYLSRLNHHERIHKKRYQCSICHKKFSQLTNLNQHNRVHTKKWYQCSVCHKIFQQLCHLKDHNRVHTGEKPYQCLVCHEKFSQVGHLNQHNRVHTGEKPYQCLVCHEKFSQSSSLNRHNRVHTGEKPYQCLVCHKKFSQLCNLNSHNRVHTGEKFEKK